ncbi:MAG: hypothetical protein SFX74_13360 [Fimbriimonadaceae bacterium]|nr:hypothetical protein [Fimbriimonadaceae bacterium]
MLTCALAVALAHSRPTPEFGPATTRATHWGRFVAIALENRHVHAVVVPQIGRLIAFGPRQGPNLLWAQREPAAGDWQNFGGDKIWVAPQSLWGWPPEPEHDGLPHVGTWDRDSITLRSGNSSKSKAVITRTFRLHGRTLIIDQTLTSRGDSAAAVGLWQIAQVPFPREIVVPFAPSDRFPKGYAVYGDTVDSGRWQRAGTSLRLTPGRTENIKYGLAAPTGTLTAVYDRYQVTLSAPFDPQGTYPDDGKAQQIYVSHAPAYVELEVTAPLQRLTRDQSQSLRTRLSFAPLPGANRTGVR